MNRDYFKLRNIEYKVSTIRIYNYSKIKWMQEIYFLSVKKMPKVLLNMNEFNVIKNENNFIEVDSQQWYEFMYYLSSIFRDGSDKRKIAIENIKHYLSIIEKDMIELTKEYSKNKKITNKSFWKIINDFVNVDVFSIFNMIIPYDILEKELKKLNLDIDIDDTYLCVVKPHRDIIKDEKIKLAIKLINNELSKEDIEKYLNPFGAYEKFEEWCLDVSYLEDSIFLMRELNNMILTYQKTELEEDIINDIKVREKRENLVFKNLEKIYNLNIDKEEKENIFSKISFLSLLATEEEKRHMIECKILVTFGKYFKDKNVDMARTNLEKLSNLIKIYEGDSYD